MRNCGDCGAVPGKLHTPGCDMERCPMCGGQAICCPCVYTENGIDYGRLEETHPEIYVGGPTDEMLAVWDAKWAAKRIPWGGEYHGKAECREYGFWCVGPPWVSVPAGTPGATEDLNRLYGRETRWDVEKQKRVLLDPEKPPAELPSGCTQCGRAWEAPACGPTHACLWQEIRCVEAVEALFYRRPIETFVGWRATSLVKMHTTMDDERAERAIARWRAWRARRRAEVERA